VPAFRALLETNTLAQAAIVQFPSGQAALPDGPPPISGRHDGAGRSADTNFIRVHTRRRIPRPRRSWPTSSRTGTIALSEDINNQQLIEYRGQLKDMVTDATNR
jgi:hypothetical protein